MHYLKAVYRARSRPYNKIERNPTAPAMSKHLAAGGRKKISLLTRTTRLRI